MNDDTGFLQEIVAHPDDPVPRLIYADWLDEHDDPRGEFLRLEVRFRELPKKDARRQELLERMRALRGDLDPSWLALLDRTKVENCGLQFQFECPRRWEQLQTTDDQTVRFCQGCDKNVHHCGSVEEAREAAAEGKCVAVDSRLTRTPGDIRPPVEMMTMGIISSEPPSAEKEEEESGWLDRLRRALRGRIREEEPRQRRGRRKK
jgi:uncharacterized protein (TIGR02996 family)